MNPQTKINGVEVMVAFQRYISEWQELERQYYQIPNWRFIKQHRNVSQRMRLTRVFTARMKKWGVISE